MILTVPSRKKLRLRNQGKPLFGDGAYLSVRQGASMHVDRRQQLVEQTSRSGHFFVGHLSSPIERDTAGGYAMSDQRVFVLRLEKPMKTLQVSRFTLSGLQNGNPPERA